MNDPINYTDPSGHFAISVGFLIGSILIGAAFGAGISGLVAYAEGERGWDLAWDIIGGGIFGAATGAAMALGAAAGAGGMVTAGAKKILELTFGKALVTATVSTAVAGGIRHYLDCAASPNQWEITDSLSAIVSGAFQGMATFGIGYLGGQVGMYDKINIDKQVQAFYGITNISKLETFAFVSKLLLGDTLARWILVSGSADLARLIISLIFGI